MENQPPYQQSFTPPPAQISLPNSTAVLVLGIISIAGCFCYGIVGLVCGIIAVVLANKDLKSYRLNPESYTAGSYSNLKAGRVCAIVGLSLSAVYLIVVIIYISVIGTAILTHPQAIFNRSM
jgi:M penetrans paralogue family 26